VLSKWENPLLIQFLDTKGRPLIDATVCVANSPISHPDIGLITDEQGQVQIEIPVAGTYAFSVFWDGKPNVIETHLDTSPKRVVLKLVR
jgi:uncharacterized GH25 family protein